MQEIDNLERDYFYHIYNRANNYENLFVEERNYSYFLQLIKKHLLPTCEIYAYCLMKNHFHLLLRLKSEKELDKTLRIKREAQPFSNLFNAYAKAINKAYSRRDKVLKI